MEITKEVLNNLKLKRGKLSEKRCQEINQMKIKNPYYPAPQGAFTPGEFFEAKDGDYFYFSEDERIVYTLAFFPRPITIRDDPHIYDDIYLLFIDDKWFEIVFNYKECLQLEKDGIVYKKYSDILKDNNWLDKRNDKKAIIYLIEELNMARYTLKPNNKEKKELNLNYKGEEYPWRNWKEL